jgi:hypothetical protein
MPAVSQVRLGVTIGAVAISLIIAATGSLAQ